MLNGIFRFYHYNLYSWWLKLDISIYSFQCIVSWLPPTISCDKLEECLTDYVPIHFHWKYYICSYLPTLFVDTIMRFVCSYFNFYVFTYFYKRKLSYSVKESNKFLLFMERWTQKNSNNNGNQFALHYEKYLKKNVILPIWWNSKHKSTLIVVWA